MTWSFSQTAPSVDSLFKISQYSDPSLSLDGKYLIALYTIDDQTSLMSFNLETMQVGRTDMPDGCDIYDYHWASNEKIIYEMSKYKGFVDNIGVITRDLKDPEILIENELVSIVDGLVQDRDNALLWFRNNPDDNSPNEYLRIVNIATGRYGKPEAHFPGRVIRWIPDMYGVARLAQVYKKGSGGNDVFYYRNSIEDKWNALDLPEGSGIYGFAPNGKHLYMSFYTSKNTSSLCLFDIEKGQVTEELFNDPECDFDGRLHFMGNPHFNPDVALKGITNNGKTIWFDSVMIRIQRDLDGLLKSTTNVIIDADTSLTKFLVASYSDIQPIQYSLFNTKKKELFRVAQSMPWINPEELCPMRKMAFTTRDSLRLHGFVTYPKSGKSPYPTVVLLHGGPQSRDDWELNPELQLLATRGYAVLQVNYRGSTGFGLKISKNSRFDYIKMHNDITDATMAAIRSGMADPNKIAIMGSSFGGYLAVCGAAFEPDLYSCAITNAGVFDWKYQWEHFKEYANSRYYDEMEQLVASKTDFDDFFYQASPINAAGKIKIPVFIAGGRDDRLVPIIQSYRLVRKMKRAGNKPVTYFKIDETHGFNYEKNRVRYYQKVLEFLGENMNKNIK